MEGLKIVLVSILAACCYGVVHDQVTARVCIEYFTIAHPPVFETQSPTLLGLGWGVIATWWMGLIFGSVLAACARFGSAPKLTATRLVRPIGILMAVTGTLAVLAGTIGYLLASAGLMQLFEPFSYQIAADRHARFIADLFAHNASYAGGGVGGLVLSGMVIRRRRKESAQRIG